MQKCSGISGREINTQVQQFTPTKNLLPKRAPCWKPPIQEGAKERSIGTAPRLAWFEPVHRYYDCVLSHFKIPPVGGNGRIHSRLYSKTVPVEKLKYLKKNLLLRRDESVC